MKIDEDARKKMTYAPMSINEALNLLPSVGGTMYVQAKIVVTNFKVPFVYDKCSKVMGNGKSCGRVVKHGVCGDKHVEDAVGSYRALTSFVTFMDAGAKEGRMMTAYILPHALSTMMQTPLKQILDLSYGMQMTIAQEFTRSVFIAQFAVKAGFISIVKFTQ